MHRMNKNRMREKAKQFVWQKIRDFQLKNTKIAMLKTAKKQFSVRKPAKLQAENIKEMVNF